MFMALLIYCICVAKNIGNSHWIESVIQFVWWKVCLCYWCTVQCHFCSCKYIKTVFIVMSCDAKESFYCLIWTFCLPVPCGWKADVARSLMSKRLQIWSHVLLMNTGAQSEWIERGKPWYLNTKFNNSSAVSSAVSCALDEIKCVICVARSVTTSNQS